MAAPEIETRSSVRLALACAGVGLAVYAACGLLVTDDAAFVRWGTTDEIAFVWRGADRAEHGEQRTVWLVGSSVVRESFDAASMVDLLGAAGIDADVQKFAFDRGAPVFTRPLLRHLPIHPGDLVVTSVAEDNFVRGWLHEADDLDLYVRFILDPRDAWTIPDLSFRERVDATVTMLPPRGFQRHRDAWIRGLDAWGNYTLGRADRPVALANVACQPFTRGGGQHLIDPALIKKRVVADDALILDASQENYAALQGWITDVEALGARPVVLFIPHHPDFGAHFITTASASRFQTVMAATAPTYVPLPPMGAAGYRDWNHPNDVGRAHYTAALAAWLSARWSDPVATPAP